MATELGIVSRKFRRGKPGEATTIDGIAIARNSKGEVFYVDGALSVGGNGSSWSAAFKTIQAAVNAASDGRGDYIYVAPGSYDETVTVNKSDLTIIGVGGRGAAFIERSTVGAEGMLVSADDVTIENIGVAGEATADYSLKINAVDRFRAYGCKFEANETALVLLSAAGDAIFEDCEFAWGVTGVVAEAGGPDPSTQIVIKNCRFHNITTVHISDGANHYANIQILDSVFDAAEDGTEPTDYLLLNDAASSGVVSGCRFATVSNDTAVLTIGANIQWLANATEAGWSTGRPS